MHRPRLLLQGQLVIWFLLVLIIPVAILGYLGVRHHFVRDTLLVGFGAVLFASLLALWAARHLSAPIKAIATAAERIATGDIHQELRVERTDEIGDLATSFRRMTAYVNDMAATADRIAGGDLNAQINPRSEADVLGNAFVKMTAGLRQLVEELQDAQAQAAQAEKLASVGQLAAGVAHELANPLGVIILYAGALLRAIPSDDPRREDLTVVCDEAARCKRIVDALLNFSRQRKLNLRPTDLNALVESVLSSVERQPRFGGVRIERLLASGLPILTVDPDQLYQVFLNIAVNAADAMPEGGTLRVVSQLDEARGAVLVSFKDTGIGIPEANLNKVFTPFFTTKQPGSGTGLGLSIAYGIVKMHRGSLTVQSREGEGTTFTVLLPQNSYQ